GVAAIGNRRDDMFNRPLLEAVIRAKSAIAEFAVKRQPRGSVFAKRTHWDISVHIAGTAAMAERIGATRVLHIEVDFGIAHIEFRRPEGGREVRKGTRKRCSDRAARQE